MNLRKKKKRITILALHRLERFEDVAETMTHLGKFGSGRSCGFRRGAETRMREAVTGVGMQNVGRRWRHGIASEVVLQAVLARLRYVAQSFVL